MTFIDFNICNLPAYDGMAYIMPQSISPTLIVDRIRRGALASAALSDSLSKTTSQSSTMSASTDVSSPTTNQPSTSASTPSTESTERTSTPTAADDEDADLTSGASVHERANHVVYNVQISLDVKVRRSRHDNLVLSPYFPRFPAAAQPLPAATTSWQLASLSAWLISTRRRR